MNTERLIASLADGAGPVRTLRRPIVRATAWALMALPLVAVGVLALGLRSDLAVELRTPMFLLVAALGLAAGLASGGTAIAMSVPGRMEEGAVRWLPVLLLVAWAGSLAWVMATDGFSVGRTFSWPSPACIGKVAAIGFLPAVVAFAFVRRGATVQPLAAGWLAAMAGLAVAAAAVPLACPIDHAGHQFFMHVLPVPVMAAGLAMLGRPWLTWIRR